MENKLKELLESGPMVINVGVRDFAESIQAQNSLEKMLAHQMAAAHALALKLAAQSSNFLTLCSSFDPIARQQVQAIEAARMASASARMMDAFNRSLLTLDRLRNGRRQTMTVQHVNVTDHAQAVVAGTVSPRTNGTDGGNQHK